MIGNNKMTGDQLIKMSINCGCQIRGTKDQHSVLWSIYTGNYFVIPNYNNEYLDSVSIKHIIWQMGLSQEAFENTYNDYCRNM